MTVFICLTMSTNKPLFVIHKTAAQCLHQISNSKTTGIFISNSSKPCLYILTYFCTYEKNMNFDSILSLSR